MKRVILATQSTTSSMKWLGADSLSVELPDRIVLTDNGAYDLEKQGIDGFYTWVGYRHNGSRSEAKMAREVKNTAYNIVVPALVEYCQHHGVEVYEDDVIMDDYIDKLDMFRVWVDSEV